MSSSVQITYVNKSMNKDVPKVFVFLKNEIPTFDVLKDSVAWKVIENIGRESSCDFIYPMQTEVAAAWDSGTCRTNKMISSNGSSYTVKKDDAEIVFAKKGNADDTKSIDVVNEIDKDNGISVLFFKDGKIMMMKDIPDFGQKTTFTLYPKLYWGVASEIQEGQLLCSAVLNSDHFAELNLENISKVVISLNGNAKDGYEFKVESQE